MISGESGAGKTETSKHFVRQLLTISNSQAGEFRNNTTLDNDILASNPLLEAVGNAKTVMNNNSSRFGKFLELKFDRHLHIKGAQIAQYLLEKSRVVHQAEGERNFHIFYKLLAATKGAGTASLGDLSLTSNQGAYRYLGGQPPADSTADLDAFELLIKGQDFDFHVGGEIDWLNKSSGAGPPDESAKAEYADLVASMKVLKFTPAEIKDFESTLAIVLNLGNVFFTDRAQDEDEHLPSLCSVNSLEKASGLLGVDAVDLAKILLSTTTVTRGETIVKKHTIAQANDTRDASTKALYGGLFRWIVRRINQFLAPADSEAEWLEVGVLDIFGFENFQTNSFEQLCINIANEQLQFYFNQHIFAWELEDMKSEGLPASKHIYSDNKPLLDMFLQRPTGLLAVLDEESFFPKATDLSCTTKMHKSFKKLKQYYEAPKGTADLNFSIHHYAGKVTYDTFGFLVKNRDSMSAGIVTLFEDSSNALVRHLFGIHDAYDDVAQGPKTVVMKTGVATNVLGEGITHTLHKGQNRRRSDLPPVSGAGEDANDPVETVNRMLGSVKRGMSMRKARASVRQSPKKKSTHRKRPKKDIKEKRGQNKRTPTVSMNFKTSLADLMGKIMAASPHFVRCIKPNLSQSAGQFEPVMVETQLRYSGVCEMVRIRREGFPVRLEFAEFVRRYQLLAFPATREIAVVDLCAACVKILGTVKLQKKDADASTNYWELGKTKIFMKYFAVFLTWA